MRLLPVFALLTGLAACGPEGPKAAEISLSPPSDTLHVAWVSPTRGIPLGGNRWAVLSPDDQIVGLVAFGGGAASILGGERHPAYGRPSVLFRAGDSLYLADWEKHRLTIWTLDGRLADSVVAPDILRGALPEARDSSGRYYAAMRTPSATIASGHPDSGAVVRLPPNLGSVDTVGRLAPPDVAEGPGESGRRYQPRALSGRDLWGILPGGTLWIARVGADRVDWLGPGGNLTRGNLLPDRALSVLPEDRQAFVQQFPPDLQRSAEQVPFALVKPPFTDALTGPDGNVWLVKSYSLADSTRSAQVVDGSGHLIQVITWAGTGRLIGVGPGALLVAARDSSGYWLYRFELPPASAAGTSSGHGVQ